MNITDIVVVGVGGAVGSMVRYVLSVQVTAWYLHATGWSAPVGTLFVNVTGSLLLGMFIELTLGRIARGSPVYLLIVVGFFGGYTTFSTFAVESGVYLRAGEWLPAILNLVIMTVTGVLAALIGMWLARMIA